MKYIREILSDNTQLSFKRVLGTVGFLTLIVALFVQENASHSVVEAIEWITISCIFGSVVEKFAKK